VEKYSTSRKTQKQGPNQKVELFQCLNFTRWGPREKRFQFGEGGREETPSVSGMGERGRKKRNHKWDESRDGVTQKVGWKLVLGRPSHSKKKYTPATVKKKKNNGFG